MQQGRFPERNSSAKGFKLLELRDKLARLNSPQRINPVREKLRRIYDENKNIEAQISSLFDRISRHYYQSQECISQITRQAIASIQYHESLLLKQLDVLKEKQLDAIKDDVERYLRHSKKIKKLMADCSINSSLEEEVKKIKPFRVNKLLQKIDSFQPEALKVDTQIDLFKQQLIQFVKNLDQQPLKKRKRNDKLKNNNPRKNATIQKPDTEQDNSNSDYSEYFNRKQDGQESSLSQRRQEEQENLIIQALEEQKYLQKQMLEGDSKTQKWQERKQAEKSNGEKNKQKRQKTKNIVSNASLVQQNIQKIESKNTKPYSANDLEAKIEFSGHQQIQDNHKIQNVTKNFLQQLRKVQAPVGKQLKEGPFQAEILNKYRKTTQVNSETSTPQQQIEYFSIKNKNKPHRLNRIKSQQRLNSPLQRIQTRNMIESPLENPSDQQKQPNEPEDIKFKKQGLKLTRFLEQDNKRLQKQLGSVRSADFAKIKTTLHQSGVDKTSRQREGKSRKGNWAQILKQQQANYMEVRRKFKN